MARIFGWSADLQGCGYWRVELPLAELRNRGHATSAAPLLPRDVSSADTIVGQRVHLPGPSTTWQRFRTEGHRLVLEIDDDLWRIDRRSRQAHHWYNKAGMLDNLARNAGIAHAVTVTTEPLAEVMRQHNNNVTVIPNFVPSWLLDHQPRQHEDVVTIGWGGSPTHDMDIAVMEDELRKVVRKERGIEVHTMGGDYSGALRIPTDRYRWTDWTKGVPGYLKSIDFHIGLIPLREHVFNDSKSHITALTYAALGIPVVASDVGPYRRFVRHGETGFLVKQPGDWVRFIRELVRDVQLRKEMGEAARRQAAEHTIEKMAHLWEGALLP